MPYCGQLNRSECKFKIKIILGCGNLLVGKQLPTFQSVAGLRFPRRHEQQQIGANVQFIRYLLLIRTRVSVSTLRTVYYHYRCKKIRISLSKVAWQRDGVICRRLTSALYNILELRTCTRNCKEHVIVGIHLQFLRNLSQNDNWVYADLEVRLRSPRTEQILSRML